LPARTFRQWFILTLQRNGRNNARLFDYVGALLMRVPMVCTYGSNTAWGVAALFVGLIHLADPSHRMRFIQPTVLEILVFMYQEPSQLSLSEPLVD